MEPEVPQVQFTLWLISDSCQILCEIPWFTWFGFYFVVVTPYVVMRFCISLGMISYPFNISNPVDKSIVAKRFYWFFSIFISHIVTQIDLVELYMLDFYVILGVDSLYACYTSIYYWKLLVTFKSWKRGNYVLKEKFISCLNARKMISKGYIYHLVWVIDRDSKTCSLKLVSIRNSFLDIFTSDVIGITLERDVNFDIELFLDAYPICVPPYHMYPV